MVMMRGVPLYIGRDGGIESWRMGIGDVVMKDGGDGRRGVVRLVFRRDSLAPCGQFLVGVNFHGLCVISACLLPLNINAVKVDLFGNRITQGSHRGRRGRHVLFENSTPHSWQPRVHAGSRAYFPNPEKVYQNLMKRRSMLRMI